MKKIKDLDKNKKIIVYSLMIVIVSFSFVMAFGRYVFNFVKDHVLAARGFYFNSQTMSANGSSHSIANWDGVNPYELTIDLNTKKNKYIKTEVDVTYTVTVSCSSNVTCTTSKNEGTIYSSTSQDSYTVTVIPTSNISEGDSATVTTTATSSSPYIKTLKTTYTINVVTYSFSYNIIDSANSKYLTLELNNSFSYYEATENFGSYTAGDNISIEEFNSLSDSDKLKCKSVIATISYDPSILRIDMTNNLYLDNKATESTEVLESHNYVNKIDMRLNANTTKKIIFYKADVTQNYSYSGEDGQTSIIDVSVDAVD